MFLPLACLLQYLTLLLHEHMADCKLVRVIIFLTVLIMVLNLLNSFNVFILLLINLIPNKRPRECRYI